MISEKGKSETPVVVLAMPPAAASEVARSLRDLGCAVRFAGTVKEASSLVTSLRGSVVILTELALPDGNWRDLLEQIRLKDAEARLVLCASTSTAELWWDALECGVSDILVPPYAAVHWERILQAAPREERRKP